MDPKKTAQLDPKLKEIYDRVMGTSVNNGTAQQQPQQPIPPQPVQAPKEPPAPPPLPPQAPKIVEPAQPQVKVAPTPPPPPAASTSVGDEEKYQLYQAGKAHKPEHKEEPKAEPKVSKDPQSQTKVEKNSMNILPVLFLVFGAIFFVGYAFFWIKFFKLNLPIPLPF